jgi:hypothetical protein
MKIIAIAAVPLWRTMLSLSLAVTAVCPLSAQLDDPDDVDSARVAPNNRIVLYEGPLVHDQQWVMRRGTTNNDVLGVFGGNCSMIPSDVRNIRGFERVRLEIDYQGLGVWRVSHVDTVIGSAIAETGQRYKYTYKLRRSVTGVTIDGKPPSPNRAMPTPTNPGFLEPVPTNIESASLQFADIFLLRDEATGLPVADAHMIGWFHRRINPSEQPPAFFPFVLDGYIATTLRAVAGQAGCDPL